MTHRRAWSRREAVVSRHRLEPPGREPDGGFAGVTRLRRPAGVEIRRTLPAKIESAGSDSTVVEFENRGPDDDLQAVGQLDPVHTFPV